MLAKASFASRTSSAISKSNMPANTKSAPLSNAYQSILRRNGTGGHHLEGDPWFLNRLHNSITPPVPGKSSSRSESRPSDSCDDATFSNRSRRSIPGFRNLAIVPMRWAPSPVGSHVLWPYPRPEPASRDWVPTARSAELTAADIIRVTAKAVGLNTRDVNSVGTIVN